ncbi:peptidyl-prolyl cis-trans isomerase [Nocardioides sp. NPDC051685]|uniref:peptidyl-prolyl cis-trans isomerase n=1 Tax=Nocardioides sp. NPDC051685 TaxID=3364334 RepID=UPI003796A89E
MFENRRRAIAVGLVLLAIAGVAVGVVVHSRQLPDDAAFRFGDQIVTRDELDDRVEVLEALYGVRRPEGGRSVDRFDRDAAKSMAVSLVLASEAAERDIVVSDKEAQTELDKLIEQQLTGGRDAFVDFLSTAGISEKDVLDEIRAQVATSRLITDVTADVRPATSEEAQRTYDEHRTEMVTPEGRSLINVVVETQADADKVASAARRTGRLDQLAATWSLDGSTRNDGGRLGVVTAQQLEKGYADAAFAAPKGEVFGPVQTTYGWNVGQVVNIVSSKPVGFDDVRKEIEERLTAEKKLKVWRDYLKKALKNAEVEYADDLRPANPTAPPEDAVGSAEPSPGTSTETPSPAAGGN